MWNDFPKDETMMLLLNKFGRWWMDKYLFSKVINSWYVSYLVDRWLVLKHVESDSLGKRSALSDSDNVTLSNVQETRRAVDWYVLVSLLKTSVLWYKLKVITTNNNSSLHFSGNNHCLKDATTDWYIASERTFLVNIWALDSFLRCLETKTDTLVISHAILSLLTQ